MTNRPYLVRHMVGVGLFLGTLTAYVSTLAPALTWRNMGSDGGDLLAAAYNLGIPHPPGYPTYTLLVKIFGSLVPVASFAFRANLFSALLGAVTVVILYYTLLYLLELLAVPLQNSGRQGSKSGTRIHRLSPLDKDVGIGPKIAYGEMVAAISSAAFAFSPLFWSQTTITKVYALNVCLAAAIIFVAVRTGLTYLQTPSENSSSSKALKGVSFSALLLGLGMGNHLTLLLLAPFLLFWYGRTLGWRRLLHPYPMVALLLGLSIYVYLPLRAAQIPPINWGKPDNLEGFLWMITADPYRGYLLGLPLGDLPGRLISWGNLFFKQFNVLGVFFGLVGGIYLWRRSSTVLYITAGFLLVISTYALTYNTGDSFVYMIPGFYVFCLWMGFGLSWLLQGIQPLVVRGMANFSKLRPGIVLMAVVLILLPVTTFLLNYRALDLSSDYEAIDYSQGLIKSLPKGSLVFAWAEKDVFGLWYMRYFGLLVYALCRRERVRYNRCSGAPASV